MSASNFDQRLFFVGAIWNWVVTGSVALAYPILFPPLGMPPPQYPVFFLLFLGVCFVLGIGYYWVSKDLDGHLGIVRLGIIAKLMVCVGALYGFLDGQLHFLLASVGIGDLIFAVLFIRFLVRRPAP